MSEHLTYNHLGRYIINTECLKNRVAPVIDLAGYPAAGYPENIFLPDILLNSNIDFFPEKNVPFF